MQKRRKKPGRDIAFRREGKKVKKKLAMPQGERIAQTRAKGSRVMKPVLLDGCTTLRHAVAQSDMDIEGNPLCPISATPPSDTSAATSIKSSSVKSSGPSSGPNRRRIFSSNA